MQHVRVGVSPFFESSLTFHVRLPPSLSLAPPSAHSESERKEGGFFSFFLYDYRYLGGAGDDVEVRRVFVILTAQTEAFGPDPEPEFRRVGSIRSVLSF